MKTKKNMLRILLGHLIFFSASFFCGPVFALGSCSVQATPNPVELGQSIFFSASCVSDTGATDGGNSYIFSVFGGSYSAATGNGGSQLTLTVVSAALGNQQVNVFNTLLNSAGSATFVVNPPPTAPSISVSPSNLVFPDTTVGAQSAPQSVFIDNTGTADLVVTSVTASGDFSQTNNCLSVNIPPGTKGGCTITVTFNPTAVGVLAGTLTISDNAPGSPHTVSLSGTGVVPAPLIKVQSNLNFPNTVLGSSSTLSLLVNNLGSANLVVSSAAATGDFSVTANNCSQPVAPGGACTLLVTFTPTAAGNRSGSLNISNNAAGSPHSVALAGVGLAESIGFSPSALTFSATALNTSSTTQTITLSNTGTANLTISSITANGDFAQTNNCPTSIAPGGTCAIIVSFTPTITGVRSGSISVKDSALGNPHSVALSGTGTAAAISLSNASLSFASTPVGSNAALQNVTVTNSGNANLIFTSIAASGDFTQTNTCTQAIAPNGTCTISVLFAPTATGARNGALTLASNAGSGSTLIALSGTGTAPVVTLSNTSLSFTAIVGTTSPAQTITVTNSGTATLTVATVAATGDYAQTNNCTQAIAPNGTCTITVTFTPTVAGTRNGAITISDNAGGSPRSVALNGLTTGVLAPIVGLSQTSLSFTSPVAVTTAAQTLTVTNSGTAALSISSIIASADYAQTNTCAAAIAPNGTCSINVTFTPPAPGVRAGTITISDNAGGSPRTITLSGTGTAAGIVLSPTTLSFSATVGTTSAVKTVTVTNSGNANLIFTSVAITANYTFTTDCPQGGIAPNASCSYNISFSPAAVGSNAGTLTLVDNAPGSPHVVNLTGTGVAPLSPIINFAPTALVFTSTSINTTSTAQTITVSNSGTASLSISNIALTGDYAQTNNCTQPLAPNANCIISVKFLPTATGARNGVITITDNASGSPHGITLSGTGANVTSPAVSLAPATLAFSTALGTTSVIKTITVTNSGSAALTVTSIVASTAFTQTNTCTQAIAPNGTCSVSVSFTPVAAGSQLGSISITDNAGGSPRTVPLSGTGSAPVVSISVASLVFAATPIGATSVQNITISNTGTAVLTVSSVVVSAGDFKQTNTCTQAIVPSASCTISVTFQPTVAGNIVGTITLNDNAAGGARTISLSGAGVVTPSAVVTLTPVNLSFSQAVIGTSTQNSVALKNSGTADLRITAISISSTDFSQTNNCPATLTANSTCAINITFKPSAVGVRSGLLIIEDNAGGSPRSINISGAAIGAGPLTMTPIQVQQIVGKQASANLLAMKIGLQTQLANINRRARYLRSQEWSADFNRDIDVSVGGKNVPLPGDGGGAAGCGSSGGKGGAGNQDACEEKTRDTKTGRWGTFIIGGFNVTENNLTGININTNGITMGGDYRLGKKSAMGTAFGSMKSTTDLAGDAGKQETAGYSLVAYGSFAPGDNGFIDVALTTGNSQYDLQRTEPVGGTAFANTKGKGVAFSFTAGYDFRQGAWVFTPYARYDSIKSNVKAYVEKGTEPISVGDQELTASLMTLGGELQYTASTSFGVLVPHLRIETQKQTQSAAMVNAQAVGSSVQLQVDPDLNKDDSFGNAALGVSAQFGKGVTGFFDFEKLFKKRNFKEDKFSLGLKVEF